MINIFEALGIGNMAPMTVLMKGGRLINDDRNFPGTINVSVCMPVFLEGFIYMTTIEVDYLTLVVNVVAV